MTFSTLLMRIRRLKETALGSIKVSRHIDSDFLERQFLKIMRINRELIRPIQSCFCEFVYCRSRLPVRYSLQRSAL